MKKEISRHALASKNIRRELKSAFPSVKFSVRSSSFSMGDSVDIDYTDGPTRAQVEQIVGKYERGSYNGMEDMYEYRPRRDDSKMGSTKYVCVNRDMSKETEMICEGIIKDNYDPKNLVDPVSELSWRRFNRTNLTNAVPIGLDHESIEDRFKVCIIA